MKLVPLFPLQIVAFPREKLNLHIFEPRYRQLIEDCQKEADLMFGIPYYREGYQLQYGTLMKLETISHVYEDGKMDIRTIGLKPMEVKRYRSNFPDKLYPGGYIEEIYWEEEGSEDHRQTIRELIDELYQFMSITKRLELLDGDFISFDIGHKVGLNREQEYLLLQIVSEEDRQVYIINHLRKTIPIIKEMEEMRKKVQLNGHFKNITPPDVTNL